MQELAPTQNTAMQPPAPSPAVGLPPYARPTSGMNPPHAKTESTLAPTSEFTRLFLLAWVVRYIPRGIAKFFFDPRTIDVVKSPVNRFLHKPTEKYVGRIVDVFKKFEHDPLVKDFLHEVQQINPELEKTDEGIKQIRATLSKALEPLQKQRNPEKNSTYDKIYADLRKGTFRKLRGNSSEEVPEAFLGLRYKDGKLGMSEDHFGRTRNLIRATWDDMAYSLMLGVGSAALSLRYSMMVRNDIKSIFGEVVAYEKGIPPDQVTFSDISASQNKILKQTVHNYWSKLGQRLATDGLFFAAVPMKSDAVTDVMLGVKGVQMFGETWKRKATLFEDITTFVNNKINPRNGLGQPVTVGEVFDLYQHYTEQFTPNKMFSNVVERGTGEGAVWADNQPIFQRIAELMNLTYAYKHQSLLDGEGRAIHQANFPLPKLIYLMGHDLIDTHQPKNTLAYIEIANRYGMEAVKDMRNLLAQGASLEQVVTKYPTPAFDKVKTAAQPAIEHPNSITKVNHADKTADLPQTTIASPAHKVESVTLPEQSFAAL